MIVVVNTPIYILSHGYAHNGILPVETRSAIPVSCRYVFPYLGLCISDICRKQCSVVGLRCGRSADPGRCVFHNNKSAAADQ